MKAIIIALGTGKRLRPVTEPITKTLLEVARRATIDHQINWLDPEQKGGVNWLLP